MTPEFSWRENSDVVPPGGEARDDVALLLLEGPTTEFFGVPLPENSVVSGFVRTPSVPRELLISLLHEKRTCHHRRMKARNALN
jgi:hypothetical protein